MTSEDLLQAIKKLPPHEHDNIPQANIDIYNEFGQLGWFHVMHEILFTENLPTKLKFINQTLINRQHRRQKAKKLPQPVKNPKSPTKRSKSVYQK